MRWLLVALITPLSGCADLANPLLEQCEGYVKANLRSPSTYKRVKSDEMVMKDGGEYWVAIDYDAANAFGTPIRDTYICRYPAKAGKPQSSGYIDFDARYENEADIDLNNLSDIPSK